MRRREIILIGSENYDQSTDLVCRWLQSWGEKFIRVNNEDSFVLQSLEINNEEIDIQFSINQKYSFWLSELKSFWYRRGGITLDNSWEIKPKSGIRYKFKKIVRQFGRNLYGEYLTLDDFVAYVLEFSENIQVIGNPTSAVNNKLIHLLKAKEAGFKIPQSHVVTNKNDLEKFLISTNKYIVKPLRDVFAFSFVEKQKYTLAQLYTNDLTDEFVKNIADSFFPSLIQQKIEKKIEIRIFVLKKKYFAMAIFSQNDVQTDLDFRRYNREKPNRYTPFKLPDKVMLCIEKFMHSANLNSGSIDLILTPNNDFVFLEINPVGQFGMVSYPCNYKIEKEIATILVNN